ncbi:unnamed protein product [Sphagnum jensenii]
MDPSTSTASPARPSFSIRTFVPMLALCRSPISTFNGTFNRLPPFLRLTHAYRYENLTLSSLEAVDGVDSTQGSDAGSSSQRGGRGRGRGRGDNTAIDTVVEGMPTEQQLGGSTLG